MLSRRALVGKFAAGAAVALAAGAGRAGAAIAGGDCFRPRRTGDCDDAPGSHGDWPAPGGAC